jgi:nickel-type superoxide dismutase maturation protease
VFVTVCLTVRLVRRAAATRYLSPAPYLAGLSAAVAAGWAAFSLLRRLKRVKVVGASMEPSLRDGDRLVVWKTAALRPGDIVACKDPRQPGRTVLKRARWLSGGTAWLEGDNPAGSTDSRHFGPVATSLVEGRAIYRYAPPGRAGWLGRRS